MNKKPNAAPEGEKTRSQKLREAGYTRRPTWKSLPKDGDDDAAPNLPDSETRDTEAIMALADRYAGGADYRTALRAAVERVIQENFTLAAGACIVDGGLVMGEYGHGICTMREHAERAEQEAAALRELLAEARSWLAEELGNVALTSRIDAALA